MGYYTHYSVKSMDDCIELYIEDMFNDIDYAECAFDSRGRTNQDCKWYEHEKDMRKFSKKYPDVVFELIGEGEESEDRWKKYFKNGKMQYAKAKIEYEEFDENKLI